MLIAVDSRPEDLVEPGLRWWSDERFAVGWKGHLFLPGERAGAASVARLAGLLRGCPLAQAMAQLHGVFGLLVHDRAAGGWQLAVDNSGLYKIFHDSGGAATSFLELLADRRRDGRAVAPHAVVEFLAHGHVAGAETLATGVLKLCAGEILELRPGAAARIVAKDLTLPSGDDTSTVLRYFADLAHSLRGRRVSADVTGGFDSRLIAGLLDRHGVEFEVAITGRAGARDIELAARVAAVLGKPFHPHHHDIARLEEELPAVFLAGDGQHEIRGFHRDWQNARARLARGVEVITHGGGGDMFKDFQVAHEFPRYGSRRIDLERYYDLRFCPLRLPPALLTTRATEMLAEIRTRTLARMAGYRAAINNETFDRIAFYIRDPEFFGRYYSNYINLGLDVVAPFLDWRNAAVARSLSPWRRFMNGWHRALMTEHCPAIAGLPTTDGYNASSDRRFLAANLLGFARSAARRVLRKASQRLLGRTLFEKAGVGEFNAPGYIQQLRATRPFAEAIARLKAMDVLAPDADPAALPDQHVPRILTVGMLLAHLDAPPARTAGRAAELVEGGQRR